MDKIKLAERIGKIAEKVFLLQFGENKEKGKFDFSIGGQKNYLVLVFTNKKTQMLKSEIFIPENKDKNSNLDLKVLEKSLKKMEDLMTDYEKIEND